MSDLGRTLETAHHIGLEATPETRLRDRDFAMFNGVPYVNYTKAKEAYKAELDEMGVAWKYECAQDYGCGADANYQKLLEDVELPGVERYACLFHRVRDLIHDIAERCSKSGKDSVNVLFVTHCSPTRMCAMVLAQFSDASFPPNLKKCDIPNNSISEFQITVNDKTHTIANVDLIKFASTKHLHAAM